MIKLSTLSSIWRCCYDKISDTVKGFDSELVKEEISRRTDFDGVRTPLKIDISTGDVITPKEMQYNFKLMLEDVLLRYGHIIWKRLWLRNWKLYCMSKK